MLPVPAPHYCSASCPLSGLNCLPFCNGNDDNCDEGDDDDDDDDDDDGSGHDCHHL